MMVGSLLTDFMFEIIHFSESRIRGFDAIQAFSMGVFLNACAPRNTISLQAMV
jgi:hypothetical protein